MSRRCLFVLFALVPVAFIAVHHLRAQNFGEVQWRYNYNDARREAETKGLPLLLDIGLDVDKCYYCGLLDKTTFRDPRVANMLNTRFIPLKINAEHQPKLAEMLRIQKYPTLVFAAPDGRIVKNFEGYQDAAKFSESMDVVIASLAPPDWMTRDYELAQKRMNEGNFNQAIPTLQRVLEESKSGPMYQNAKGLLDQMEQKAGERMRAARRLHDDGKTADAMKMLADTARDFPGLQATKNAGDTLAALAQMTAPKTQRNRVAQDLLAQAREFYQTGSADDCLLCLDRCETLVAKYGDLPEGKEAFLLATEIKSNPEWLAKAAAHLADRLAAMYLALGEAMLARGQHEQAIHYFERVVQSFPDSRRAANARDRLEYLQRQPTFRVTFPER